MLYKVPVFLNVSDGALHVAAALDVGVEVPEVEEALVARSDLLFAIQIAVEMGRSILVSFQANDHVCETVVPQESLEVL